MRGFGPQKRSILPNFPPQNSASVLHLNLVFHSKLNTSASSNIKILSRDIGVMSRDVVEIPVTDKTVEISLDGGERALNLLITVY